MCFKKTSFHTFIFSRETVWKADLSDLCLIFSYIYNRSSADDFENIFAKYESGGLIIHYLEIFLFWKWFQGNYNETAYVPYGTLNKNKLSYWLGEKHDSLASSEN